MPLTLKFKEHLLQECKKIVNERMEAASKAMQAAQEAANGEDKSSAGDKYETSRAMGHRDRDMYARQLVEAKNELEKLNKINIEESYKIRAGSLMQVNDNFYFIAIGLGKIKLDDKDIMVMSQVAPISGVMMNKKTGDEFNWNGKLWKIGIVI